MAVPWRWWWWWDLVLASMETETALAVREAATNVWRKLQLFAVGFLHLLFSSDQRWPSPRVVAAAHHPRGALVYGSDSAPSSSVTGAKIQHKRIIFVRHAESEWNVVFNRGVWWLAIVRFGRAIVREWLMMPTPDSIFIDSPLSRRGIHQAKSLHRAVCERSSPHEDVTTPPDHLLRYLGCPLPKSIIVASNLRRAIDTARIASAARLELPGERIHVLSCLQEIGRNIDTLAISDAYTIAPKALSGVLQGEKGEEELFNLSESHGNKSILGCGRQRLHSFAQWCFFQSEDVIVVYGHSHWFRAFCREFMPARTPHVAKHEKLANCGVVSFLLEERRALAPVQFAVDTQSFEFIH